MKNNYIYLWISVFILFSAGCSHPVKESGSDQLPNTVVVERPVHLFNNSVNSLLKFASEYQTSDSENQKKMFNTLLQESKIQKTTDTQLRLATIYAMPGSAQRDNAKAIALTQSLINSNILSEEETAYTQLLQTFCTDTGRMLSSAKEDAKKYESLNQKYDALQKKYNALEQKQTALEQKLNDIRNIEKKLNERDTK